MLGQASFESCALVLEEKRFLSRPDLGIVRLGEGKQSVFYASSNTTTRLFAHLRRRTRLTKESNVQLDL